MSDYTNIKDRRHEILNNHGDIFDLVRDSYIGGYQYVESGHLERYHRESLVEYNSRKKRAVYFNYLQPIVDILVGFLYEEIPDRQIPDSLSYLVETPYRNKSLDNFMQRIATEAFCYPCFVLIDSPDFDPEQFDTVAKRNESGLHPYAVLYRYNEIIDFDIDDMGNLSWIILDVSWIDKSDPTQESRKRKVYRLWTSEYVQDFEITEDAVVPGEQKVLSIGRIPGVFVDIWTSLSDDSMGSSPAEDIALISKRIYNNMSYMDEMLASGSFKNLFFPIETSQDLPDEVRKEGIGALTVIPYNGKNPGRPFYDGADIGDVSQFIEVIKLYIREIFRKIGMELPEDSQRGWNESGKAKNVEFRKTEAILRNAANALENVEIEMFRIAARWEGSDFDGEITYNKKFDEDMLDDALTRLYQAFSMPFDTVKRAAARRIVNKTLPDLEDDEAKQIKAEIDSYEESQQIDVNNYLEQDDS